MLRRCRVGLAAAAVVALGCSGGSGEKEAGDAPRSSSPSTSATSTVASDERPALIDMTIDPEELRSGEPLLVTVQEARGAEGTSIWIYFELRRLNGGEPKTIFTVPPEEHGTEPVAAGPDGSFILNDIGAVVPPGEALTLTLMLPPVPPGRYDIGVYVAGRKPVPREETVRREFTVVS